MADYVATFKVQLDDKVSQNAHAAATVMGELSVAADTTTAATDKAAASAKNLGDTMDKTAPALGNVTSGLAEYANKIGEAVNVSSALNAINDTYQAGLTAIKSAYDAGISSLDETTAKETKLAATRDSQTQAARKQSQTVADGLNVQTQATDTAKTSSDDLGTSQAELAKHEIGLYAAISGGKATLTALAENMAKTAAGTGSAGAATDALGRIVSALLSPIGLTVTALVAFGVASYEVFKRSSDLADQQRSLSVAIAGTGRSASTSVAQLVAYTDALEKAGVATDDANKIAGTLARTQGLTAAQARQVVSLTPGTAIALNVNDIEAAKQLTQAELGSADAIKELDKVINFLTPDQAANVAVMIQQGEKTDAVRIAMDALHVRVDSLRKDSLSPTDQAFLDLKTHWNDFINTLASSGPVMMEVQGWSAIFTALANSMKDSTLSQQLADLTGQAASLQLQIAQQKNTPQSTVGAVTDWVKGDLAKIGIGSGATDLQAQLDAVNLKITALVEKSQKLRDNLAAPITAATTIKGGVDDPTTQEAKDLFTTAQGKVNSSSSGQIAALTAENKKFTDQLAQMGARTTDNAARFDAFTTAIKVNQDAIDKLNTKTVSQFEKQSAALDSQIKEQTALTAAYAKGYDQVALIIAQQLAEKDVIRDGLVPGTKEYKDAVQELTDKQIKLQQVKANANIAKDLRDTNEQGDAQLRINAAYDGTTLSVTNAENAERARSLILSQGLTPANDNFTASVNAQAASFDRATAASTVFAQQQASVQALTGIMTNAFDQVGSAIVSAFTSGSGSAVNFSAVFKSVIQSVLTEVAKLAIINPIVNSILNTNSLPTLGSGLSTLFGGGGGSPGQTTTTRDASGNIISTSTSVLGTGSSISGLLGGPTIGSTLGLTGEGGLLTGLGSVPLFSGGATLAGAGAAPGLIAGGANGLIAEGAISSIGEAAPVTLSSLAGTSVSGTVGAGGIGAGTVSGIAGGAAAGFAAGSLSGSLIAGSLNKAPSINPEVGAAIGTGVGAAIGTFVFPVIGTALGAFLGGALGGSIGGLFGPHKASVFSTTDLTVDKGQIEVGKTIQQGVDAYPRLKAVVAQIDALQKFESEHNIATTGQSDRIQIGINNPGGFQDPTKYGDLNTPNVTGHSAFSLLSFGSQNPIENDKISKKVFANADELGAWVTAFDAAQTATQNIISGTTSLTGQFGVTVGSVNTSLKAINDQFDGADATIKALLASEYLSADQTVALTKAENDLTTLRGKAIAKVNEQLNSQVDAANQSLMGRFLAATAANDNSPLEAKNAQLYSFDVQATQQRLAFKNSLVDLYGDGYLATSAYADEVSLQEKTLGAERLSIQKSFNDQITAADKAARDKSVTDAGATIVNLSQYLQKLRTGTDSPLSAQDQLTLSRQAFTTDTNKIKAGDLSGLPSITSDADALLAASRAVNGSGTGFVGDFNKVLSTISTIATIPIDTLTAGIFAAETRSQTAVLSDGLSDLQKELAAIRLELRQAANIPSQVAA